MFVPLAALTMQFVITVADTVPTYDVAPSCRAAASAVGAAQDRMQSCLESEKRARDQIVELWPKLSAADRSRCTQRASVGGGPTYTELITCLELAHDLKNPPASQTLAPLPSPSTSGMGQRQPRPSQPPGPGR